MAIQAGLTGPPHTATMRIRVWSDRPGSDAVVRFANTGQPVPGIAITPITVPPALIADGRLFRRVIEIAGAPADADLRIEMGGEACQVRTAPAPGSELRILIGSCFHIEDDRGRVLSAWRRLNLMDRPHVRIHCGDQIYMDAGPLPDGPDAFARSLLRYRRYWEDRSHVEYMRDGITLFAADDHEFWNDYPYAMPHLSRSHDAQWREHAIAAERLFLAWQALGHPGGRTWFPLDLGAVSMFMLDTRTRRGTESRNPPKRLFDADQRAALLEWSATLEKPGLLVSSMPLFQDAEGKVLFFSTDHNMLAFPEDARVIWRAVEQAAHNVIVLAGDIHQARCTEWRTGSGASTRRHFEIVSSPLRLLSWPKIPVLNRPLFGRGRAERAESVNLGVANGRRDPAVSYFGTSVDHFSLLRLRPVPTGLQVSLSVRELPDARIPDSQYGGGRCALEFDLIGRG